MKTDYQASASIRYLGLMALLATAGMAGCNPRDAGNLTQDARNFSQHAGQAIGSASLAGKVNTVLSLRKGVDMSGLHIDAQDGLVTLGGHVRNPEERRRIVNTVNGIRGVERVVDKMRIQAPESRTGLLDRFRR